MSRTEFDKSDSSGISMFPLPVFEKNSASINMVRRKNSSKESVARYIRLNVIYSESQSFTLTVDKSICFEKLACMIEAEYYFLHSELIPCCIILSEDWVPFHWDWNIGHHLTTGSVVRIVDYTNGK